MVMNAAAGVSQRTLMLLLTVLLAHSVTFGDAFQGNLVDECAFVAKRQGGGAPPVVAFLVGLEGTGHHLVTAVVKNMADKPGGNLYAKQQPRLDGEVSHEGPPGTDLLEFLHDNPQKHFFFRSYPAGHGGRRVHSARARVSLVKLICLNATGAIDLRLAFLRRDPVDAVCSALRRFVHNDINEVQRTADIALESFSYILSVLNHAEAAYEVIDFAEVVADKNSLIAPLVSLLRGVATTEAINTTIQQTPIPAKHHGDAATGGKRASCDDGETRSTVLSRMQPANNGSLHATPQNGSIKDYWQLDVQRLRDSATRTTASPKPGLSRADHTDNRSTSTLDTPAPVPRLLVQWGRSRTGTTFQYTTLCASAVLLSLREAADPQMVNCMFTHGVNKTEIRNLESKEHTTLEHTGRFVIKTHNRYFAMGKMRTAKHAAWLFATSISPEKKGGMLAMAKYTQPLTELNAQGAAMASKYAQLLGLTPSETADLQSYIQRWDSLRICCGIQMSLSYRNLLQNVTESHKRKNGVFVDHSQYCSSLDLDNEEQELMATRVFQHGKHIEAIARNTATELPFTGTYCTQANRVIAEHHLKFNEDPRPFMPNAAA